MKKICVLILLIALLLLSSACAKKETPAPAAPAVTEAPAAEINGFSFTVFCRTEDGQPVANARVQVCTGSLCRVMSSDENGLFTFYGTPGTLYDVTPMNAPQGYALVSDRAVAVTENGQRIEFLFSKQ